MNKPMVSIVVTTKNEEHHIRPFLESVRKQKYPSIEIIVVDNHSEDATIEIAKNYTRHVYEAGPERSAQRNFGASKAKGTYFLFLDADMIISTWVVAECVGLCEKHNFVGAVIPEKSFGIGFWAKCKELERKCYEHIDWIESARFFKTQTFREAGGYDESLTGPEDFELAQRIKARMGKSSIGRISAYILHDEGRLSLAKLLRKKYYYGMQMQKYGNLTESREYFAKQSNVFLRYWLYLRHPKMFIEDPVHAFGMLVMKLLEMVALAFGAVQKGTYAEKR